MAPPTKGDEIFFHIASRKAVRFHAMDLQILGTSASLASPAIALQHLRAKELMGVPVLAKPELS
jgi:hypothetical protein